jgi:hypothetical protein
MTIVFLLNLSSLAPAHWLVGAMTIGAVIFLTLVELHSRRTAKSLTDTKDQKQE